MNCINLNVQRAGDPSDIASCVNVKLWPVNVGGRFGKGWQYERAVAFGPSVCHYVVSSYDSPLVNVNRQSAAQGHVEPVDGPCARQQPP